MKALLGVGSCEASTECNHTNFMKPIVQENVKSLQFNKTPGRRR